MTKSIRIVGIIITHGPNTYKIFNREYLVARQYPITLLAEQAQCSHMQSGH